jgi:SAM-dependent methyltransferase
VADWDLGEYERTARALAPAAEVVVATAGLQPGETVADLACGTGNAAALAAAAGCRVVGVDLARRLLEVAREQVPQATFLHGDLEALPLDDDAVDVAVSVFGVIFAGDGRRAVAEMRRVVRPGGRVVLSAWPPEGPVHAIGRLAAQRRVAPPATWPPRLDWHDADALQDAFGVPVELERHTVDFIAASPEAWWDEQVRCHPMWLAAGEPAEGLRDESIAILREANLATDGTLRMALPYAVARVKL